MIITMENINNFNDMIKFKNPFSEKEKNSLAINGNNKILQIYYRDNREKLYIRFIKPTRSNEYRLFPDKIKISKPVKIKYKYIDEDIIDYIIIDTIEMEKNNKLKFSDYIIKQDTELFHNSFLILLNENNEILDTRAGLEYIPYLFYFDINKSICKLIIPYKNTLKISVNSIKLNPLQNNKAKISDITDYIIESFKDIITFKWSYDYLKHTFGEEYELIELEHFTNSYGSNPIICKLEVYNMIPLSLFMKLKNEIYHDKKKFLISELKYLLLSNGKDLNTYCSELKEDTGGLMT